jgi:glutaredoxin-related protein
MPSSPARRTLAASRLAPQAVEKQVAFHRAIVDEVERAVSETPIVVVGMAQNPHCKEVRKSLGDAGLEFKYIEYGSYFSKWKERLAVKLWSGWPTFPQVFVRGVLIGGADLTAAGIADGTLKQRLDAGAPSAQGARQGATSN